MNISAVAPRRISRPPHHAIATSPAAAAAAAQRPSRPAGDVVTN